MAHFFRVSNLFQEYKLFIIPGLKSQNHIAGKKKTHKKTVL